MDQTIQLYSFATPNGQKIGLALEEMGLSYKEHFVDIMKGQQFASEFIKINPNSKIPAIVDPDGPNGEAISVFESAAILIYLARKSKKFLPEDPRKEIEVMQWLFFQMSGLGPMFGQFGHFFKYAKDKCDHPYPVQRYTTESKRLLGVLDKQLAEGRYIVGAEYTIADMAIYPWIQALSVFYKADEALGLSEYKNIKAWSDRITARPATAKGMKVCSPS